MGRDKDGAAFEKTMALVAYEGDGASSSVGGMRGSVLVKRGIMEWPHGSSLCSISNL